MLGKWKETSCRSAAPWQELNFELPIIKIMWRPCSFTPVHSVTGLVGQLFAPCLLGQKFASQGCTQTYKKKHQGSRVSDVSLHWWPQCDPWSLATIGHLCWQSHDGLSHWLPWPCLRQFHSAPCWSSSSLLSDQLNPLVKLLGDSPVEALQLHSNTHSHWSSWSTFCFPPRGAAGHRSGDAVTLTKEPSSPVSYV